MSWMFAWFQNDDIAELKQHKEKLVEKKAKLEEEIKAIDERIAELESKNKNSD